MSAKNTDTAIKAVLAAAIEEAFTLAPPEAFDGSLALRHLQDAGYVIQHQNVGKKAVTPARREYVVTSYEQNGDGWSLTLEEVAETFTTRGKVALEDAIVKAVELAKEDRSFDELRSKILCFIEQPLSDEDLDAMGFTKSEDPAQEAAPRSWGDVIGEAIAQPQNDLATEATTSSRWARL